MEIAGTFWVVWEFEQMACADVLTASVCTVAIDDENLAVIAHIDIQGRRDQGQGVEQFKIQIAISQLADQGR